MSSACCARPARPRARSSASSCARASPSASRERSSASSAASCWPRAMIGFLSSTRAALVVGLPLPPLGLLLAFVLGLGVTLASALIPAMRAARLSPVDALRPPTRTGMGLVDRLRWLVVAELVIVALGVLLLPVERSQTPDPGDHPVARHPARWRRRHGLRARAAGPGHRAPVRVVLRRAGPARPREPVARPRPDRADGGRDDDRARGRGGARHGGRVGASRGRALGRLDPARRLRHPQQRAARRRVVPSELRCHARRAGRQSGVRGARRPRRRGGQEEVALAGIDPNVFQDAGALIVRGAERADAYEDLRDPEARCSFRRPSPRERGSWSAT